MKEEGQEEEEGGTAEDYPDRQPEESWSQMMNEVNNRKEDSPAERENFKKFVKLYKRGIYHY